MDTFDNLSDRHNYYMTEALKEAQKAGALMEVPIGCVIEYQDRIIGRGCNMRNTKNSALGHAEITAIEEATSYMEDWRLEECTMYVTVEPCPMCAGAILQSRMTGLVIGTMNAKAGCVGSIYNLLEDDRFNHVVQVTRGVMEEACSQVMSDFFRELRNERKAEKDAADKIQSQLEAHRCRSQE